MALILVFSQQAGAAETIILFDELFVRGTSTPSIEFRGFQGYDRSATIEIFNGGLPDSQDNRTSNAVVRVNGETLFGPSKLKRSTSYLQKEVMLVKGENTLGVELRGEPGGRIRVRVSQIRPQRDYSGIYCLTQEVCKDKNSTSLEIFQTGSTVTFIYTDDRGVPYTGSGTVDGNEMTLTIDIPDGQGQFIIAIRFSDDGTTFEGTYSLPWEQGSASGYRGICEAKPPLIHRMPFSHTVGLDSLEIPTPGGTVYGSISSWGAHFMPITGHAHGDPMIKMKGYPTRGDEEIDELVGDGDGVCESGETCGFWEGDGGERIRSRTPVYTAPLNGRIVKVWTFGPHPGAADGTAYSKKNEWTIYLEFDDEYVLSIGHLSGLVPNLRDKIYSLTGKDTDTYEGPLGVDILGCETIEVAAGEELAYPMVLAIPTEGFPGYYRRGLHAQMEFTIQKGEIFYCNYDLMDPAEKARLQGVLDADMTNPASERYGSPPEMGGIDYWSFKWSWGAEGRLCMFPSSDLSVERPPEAQDFSSIHSQMGAWIKRLETGDTFDELFVVVKIAKDAKSYDPLLYSSPLVDYLVLRRTPKTATYTFEWTMPDGSSLNPWYPNGEVLDLTNNSLLIKWRDIINWGALYQRVSYILDAAGLKIKWGNFSETEASAFLPVLSADELCNGTDVICYDHTWRDRF